jgi:signal transduction histidine kinase
MWWLLLVAALVKPAAGKDRIPLVYHPVRTNYFGMQVEECPGIVVQLNEIRNAEGEAALQVARQALRQSELLHCNAGIAHACLVMGLIYNKMGRSNEAIAAYKRGFSVSRGLADTELAGRQLNGLGGVYFYQSNYPYALYWYYRAANEIETGHLKSPRYQASVYNNLGMIWNQYRNADKARHYLEKARGICLANKEYNMLARNYCNYGNYYLNTTKDTVKAKASLENALRIGTDIDEKYTMQLASMNLANIALEQGLPAEARRYLDPLLANIRSLTPRMGIVVHCGYGKALILQGRAEKALPYMLEALTRSKAIHNTEYLVTIYLALANIYKARNDATRVLTYMDKAMNAYATANTRESREKALEMDSRFQTALKDKQIATQQLEISRQQLSLQTSRFWTWAGVAGMLLLSALWVVSYRNYRHRQRLQENRLKGMQQEQQIVQLQSRINGEEHVRQQMANALHDGIASQLLNLKLRLQMMGAGEESASDMDTETYDMLLQQINETAHEVRSMAHQLTPDILLNEGLVHALGFYCRKVQTSTLIKVGFQTTGEIPRFDPDFELVLYRMAQELMQNVVKHSHASQVLVQLSCHGQVLALTVEDNGIGIGEGAWLEGAGLSSIRSRMKIYNGHIDIMNNYGTAIYLEFDTQTIENKLNHAG